MNRAFFTAPAAAALLVSCGSSPEPTEEPPAADDRLGIALEQYAGAPEGAFPQLEDLEPANPHPEPLSSSEADQLGPDLAAEPAELPGGDFEFDPESHLIEDAATLEPAQPQEPILEELPDQPMAALSQDGHLHLTTWGSSSCPSRVTGLELQGPAELRVTLDFPYEDIPCTADMAATTHVLELPEEAQELPLTVQLYHEQFDTMTVPVEVVQLRPGD